MHSIEIGIVQKAFWCLRGGGSDYGSTLPTWLWPAHEIYFTIIVLVIPGGIMVAAYGAIAVKLCKCMKERSTLSALKEKSGPTKKDRLNRKITSIVSLVKKPAAGKPDEISLNVTRNSWDHGNSRKSSAERKCCDCCEKCDYFRVKEIEVIDVINFAKYVFNRILKLFWS